jgi:hypothetical protein
MIFDEGFALMLSIIGRPDGKEPRRGGMVLEGDEYHHLVDCRIDTDFDDLHHQTGDADVGQERDRQGVRDHRSRQRTHPVAQPTQGSRRATNFSPASPRR